MSNQYDLIVGTGATIFDPNAMVMQVKGGTTILKVGPQMLRNGGQLYHDELQYLALLQELVEKSDAAPREDRTGTGTFSVFGRQIRFDLTQGFPLLTTKKLFTKGIIAELLWMLSGSTNIKPLVDQGVHIWDEWADENGSLGPVYGAQWRAYYGGTRMLDEKGEHHIFIDQIKTLLIGLHEKPNDRGHIVTAWNPAQLDQMALRPCHCLMQFYVDDGKLSCQLYQRSADIFLGVPFNIASYALLTHLIAREVGLFVGEFVHTFGDLHLYANHVEQAKEQLTRTPKPLPKLILPEGPEGWPGLFSMKPEYIAFDGYDPHPKISAEVSV